MFKFKSKTSNAKVLHQVTNTICLDDKYILHFKLVSWIHIIEYKWNYLERTHFCLKLTWMLHDLYRKQDFLWSVWNRVLWQRDSQLKLVWWLSMDIMEKVFYMYIFSKIQNIFCKNNSFYNKVLKVIKKYLKFALWVNAVSCLGHIGTFR